MPCRLLSFMIIPVHARSNADHDEGRAAVSVLTDLEGVKVEEDKDPPSSRTVNQLTENLTLPSSANEHRQ